MIKIHQPGVTMTVRNYADHFEVTLLIVEEKKRGAGLGSQAIRGLQQFGRVIRLTAVPHDGFKSALHRFYRRLGFRTAGKDAIGHTNFVWTPGGAR